MAGEAGLLGLAAVLESARRAEHLARKWHASRSESDAAELAVVLREVESALAGLRSERTSPERTGP